MTCKTYYGVNTYDDDVTSYDDVAQSNKYSQNVTPTAHRIAFSGSQANHFRCYSSITSTLRNKETDSR